MGKSNNAVKLHRLIESLSIPVGRLAGLLRVSPSQISRIISAGDAYEGSPQLFMSLERLLGRVIEERRVQIFDHDSIPADELDQCLRKGL